jgi:hypothetical protein
VAVTEYSGLPEKQEPPPEREDSPMSHSQERRKLARLPLEVLAQVRVLDTGVVAFAETLNVSAGGVFLYTQAVELDPGAEVECILVLPEKLTLAQEPILVECRGKVLRVKQELPARRTGVAIEIHSYNFAWHGDLLSDKP